MYIAIILVFLQGLQAKVPKVASAPTFLTAKLLVASSFAKA
jgi:hypothetical protein